MPAPDAHAHVQWQVERRKAQAQESKHSAATPNLFSRGRQAGQAQLCEAGGQGRGARPVVVRADVGVVVGARLPVLACVAGVGGSSAQLCMCTGLCAASRRMYQVDADVSSGRAPGKHDGRRKRIRAQVGAEGWGHPGDWRVTKAWPSAWHILYPCGSCSCPLLCCCCAPRPP